MNTKNYMTYLGSVEVEIKGIKRKREKMTEYTDKKKSHAIKWFLIHGFILITWTPLVWVISGEILDSYIQNYAHKLQIQWGFASSTVLFNAYSMARKLRIFDRHFF